MAVPKDILQYGLHAARPAASVDNDGIRYFETDTNVEFQSNGSSWVQVAGIGSGDVTGPGSSVSGNFASFNGTGGKTIQDSGYKSGDFAPVTHNLLSATHGDTTAASGVIGDLMAFISATWQRLAGNTTATRKFLRSVGAGGVAAAPAWDTLAADDYPDFVGSGASHAKGAVPDPGAGAGTTKFLREDASWQVPGGGGLADPGSNGIVTRTALNTTGIAAASDVTGLFSGVGDYLKSDGSKGTPATSGGGDFLVMQVFT